MSTIREILRVLFAGGMTYREIGGIIGISHNTVSRYDRLRVEKSITLEEIESMDDTALENSFNARPLLAMRIGLCQISSCGIANSRFGV